jgi:hypothetical protein
MAIMKNWSWMSFQPVHASQAVPAHRAIVSVVSMDSAAAVPPGPKHGAAQSKRKKAIKRKGQ